MCVFLLGSSYVPQAGLEHQGSNNSPDSDSQAPGTTGMHTVPGFVLVIF